MKVVYREDKLSAEFNVDTPKELFKQLGDFQEVFGQTNCGKCESNNLRYVVRENDGNEYHELRCADCGAKLAFGVNKTGGGLFPRRKNADGEWLPDNGWTKWNPKTKSVE